MARNQTKLTCTASGNPEPKYQWLQLQQSQVFQIYVKRVIIRNKKLSHFVKYTLLDQNQGNKHLSSNEGIFSPICLSRAH